MMRRLRYSVVLPLLLACSAALADGSRALVIGISQYANLDGVRFADADARKFAQILTGFAGYQSGDVVSLLNAQATRQRITDEIGKVVRLSEQRPLEHFILMFAGHGLPGELDARGTRAFLAPFDAAPEGNTLTPARKGVALREDSFIDRVWLAQQLSAIKSKNVAVVLDCCHGGTESFGKLFFENVGHRAKTFGPRKVAYLAPGLDRQQSGTLSASIFESIKRAQSGAYADARSELSVESMYADLKRSFRMPPVAEALAAKDMIFLRVQGAQRRVVRTAHVEIITEPAGFEIFVDGVKRRELTNGVIELTEGRHQIELFLPATSYRHSFTVDLKPADILTQRFDMRGRLQVDSFWLKDGQKSAGPVLELTLNGNRISQGQPIDKLTAGTHELRARYRNAEKTRRVEIRPDSPLQVNYSVDPGAEPITDPALVPS